MRSFDETVLEPFDVNDKTGEQLDLLGQRWAIDSEVRVAAEYTGRYHRWLAFLRLCIDINALFCLQ